LSSVTPGFSDPENGWSAMAVAISVFLAAGQRRMPMTRPARLPARHLWGQALRLLVILRFYLHGPW
jgi:hypothetical protein